MRIGDICTRKVILIREDASIRDAAQEMRRRHVGSLVVVGTGDGGYLPVGILTDRDIVLAVVAADVDARKLRVGDVMTRKLATCAEEEYLFDAIQTMRQRGVRRLPVLDRGGNLCGMVTADDIYGAMGRHLSELSRALVHEQALESEARI